MATTKHHREDNNQGAVENPSSAAGNLHDVTKIPRVESSNFRAPGDTRETAAAALGANKLDSYSTDSPALARASTAYHLRHLGAAAIDRADEKKQLLLVWTYAHGVIDSHVAMLLDGTITERTAAQTLRNYERVGLLQRVHVSGCLVAPFMLTNAGARWVDRHAPSEVTRAVNPWTYPSDLPVKTMEHRLLTAIATVRAAKEVMPKVLAHCPPWTPAMVLSERVLLATGRTIPSARKTPDALIINGDSSVAVEVQETFEHPLTRERIITTYAEALQKREISYVVWASTRSAILHDYKRLGTERVCWCYHGSEKRWQRKGTFVHRGDQKIFTPETDHYSEVGSILTLDLSDMRRRYYRSIGGPHRKAK